MPAPKANPGFSPPEEGPSHEICWAKTTATGDPGITAYDHCLNVGCVAQEIVDALPQHTRDLAPAGATCLAALHDVGKVSPGFQAKCAQWLERHNFFERARLENWGAAEADHARVSQLTLQRRLPNSNMHCWAAAAGAHRRTVLHTHGADQRVVLLPLGKGLSREPQVYPTGFGATSPAYGLGVIPGAAGMLLTRTRQGSAA